MYASDNLKIDTLTYNIPFLKMKAVQMFKSVFRLKRLSADRKSLI